MTSTIKSIQAIPIGMPFTQHEGPPAGFGGKVWETLDILLVRVETSDGIVGWGDAFSYNAMPATLAAVVDILTPLALGQDCTDVPDLMDRLARPLHLFGRSGPVQYALSGLDIALWDIAGKRQGRPIWQLLDGPGRKDIPSYASLFRVMDHAMLTRVCSELAADGFTAIKLHEVDPETTLAARQGAGPDVELMMDTNCPWSLAQAQEAAAIMVPANLKWLEEPIWPPEDFAALSALAASGIDLAAGENVANDIELTRLATTPGMTYVQPSVTKIGGITLFHRGAQNAVQAGRQIAPHSPYFGPGLLATLHLAAVFPQIEYAEMFGARLTTPLFDGVGLPGPDQRFVIPNGPGLGADPIAEVIDRFRLG